MSENSKQIVNNEIINDDVVDALTEMPDNYFQSVVADPPYYNVLEKHDWDTQWDNEGQYLHWMILWIKQCMRVLKNDGLFFCFGQLGKREHVFIHLMSLLCYEYKFHDLIIWDRAVGYNDRKDSFTPAYEMIFVLRKTDNVKFNKGAVRIPYDEETIKEYLKDDRYKDKNAREQHLLKGKYSTNILRVASLKGTSNEKCGHPSQKPETLIEKLILCSTDMYDVVLDPFLGSGTTAYVAQNLCRNWVGIEKDKKYVSIAQRRVGQRLF